LELPCQIKLPYSSQIGGTEGVDFSAVCADAAQLLKQREKLVFVHGGSARPAPWVKPWAHAAFITAPSGYTSRYTDRKTLEISPWRSRAR